MTSTYSFASKTTNASASMDSIMGMFLPKPLESSPPSSSHSSSSFRTTTPSSTYASDPELYMGDDSDCDYAQALMQSGMFSTDLNPSSSVFDQDSDCSDTDDHTQVSINRLRLLLAHLNPHTSSSAKGKSKSFY
ncbi:hypothetical protein BCR42DRAFT_407695 [Absidia repens]|uniref:Uncharacterized protein n=1 Tax=Absidia repens TaxID=90262 RepID=A0A1X2ISK3_9FUNG|nr:hypothetical protein BCR42DRAFT_407695 [Absidia repens]